MATTIQIKEINEQTITSGRSIYDEKVLKDNDQQEPLDGRKEVDGKSMVFSELILLLMLSSQYKKRLFKEKRKVPMVAMVGSLSSVLLWSSVQVLEPQQVGVMQDYYERHVFGIESSVQLSFVGTLALVFINLMGPVAQILRSIVGLRMVMVIGMLLITIGLEMAGFAWQIWHLYLTQGILFGSGASLMYCMIMAVAPQYFTRRRGLALGLIASGSGIGGLVIPFIMSPINSSIGPAWTYRVMGFVCLACDLVAVALIKELKPAPKQRKKFTDIVKFGVLKDVNFVLFCVGSDLALMGYFVPFFYLPSYASSYGVSYSQGSALVAVAATANFVGRILAGIMADRIGRINTNIIITILGGLSSFLIWTFAFTYGVMMAFAVIFGLFCGSYFALLSPITASILGMERFPSGLSLLLITNIISVFGPNISGGIEASVSDIQPYFVYKMFTGACYLAGSVFLIALKLRMDKNPFAKI